MLSFVQVENIPIEQLTLNIVEGNRAWIYNYDSNLEKNFLESNRITEDCKETLSLIYCGSDGSRSFHLKDEKDNYSSAVKGMCDFEFEWCYFKDHLKDFISDLGYSFYLQKGLNLNGLRQEELYLPACKTIILDRRCIKNRFYHAIGHAIDFELNMMSEQFEFQRVFKLDKNRFYDFLKFMSITAGVIKDCNYYMNDIRECFAEGFNQYYINGTVLENHCPNIYNYFQKLDEILKHKYVSDKKTKKLKN